MLVEGGFRLEEEKGSSVGRRRAEDKRTGWGNAMEVGRKVKKGLAPGGS